MMRLIWKMVVPGSSSSCWTWALLIAVDVAFFAACDRWFSGTWFDILMFALNAYSFDYQRRHAT